MKCRSFLVLFSLVITLAFTACQGENSLPTAPGQNGNISLTVDLNSGSIIEPGYEWVDNDGIRHIQGRVTAGEIVSGDLAGTFVRTLIKNATYDPATGSGESLISVECDVTWPARKLNGSFAGDLSQEFSAGIRTSSEFEAQGRGGFSGMKLKMSFKEKEAGSGMLYGTGKIINP